MPHRWPRAARSPTTRWPARSPRRRRRPRAIAEPRRLVYLASARRDLLEIATYLARQSGSRAVAEGFTGLLRGQCTKLAGLPGALGRPRPELHADMRSFAFRGYVIFFIYEDDTLRVVNILEGHRDVDTAADDASGH